MPTPEFQRQLDNTGLGNEALPLTLGAISLLERLESAVPAEPAGEAEIGADPDEALAGLALLGLISFGNTLRRRLAEVQDEPDGAPESDEMLSAISDVMR